MVHLQLIIHSGVLNLFNFTVACRDLTLCLLIRLTNPVLVMICLLWNQIGSSNSTSYSFSASWKQIKNIGKKKMSSTSSFDFDKRSISERLQPHFISSHVHCWFWSSCFNYIGSLINWLVKDNSNKLATLFMFSRTALLELHPVSGQPTGDSRRLSILRSGPISTTSTLWLVNFLNTKSSWRDWAVPYLLTVKS